MGIKSRRVGFKFDDKALGHVMTNPVGFCPCCGERVRSVEQEQRIAAYKARQLEQSPAGRAYKARPEGAGE